MATGDGIDFSLNVGMDLGGDEGGVLNVGKAPLVSVSSGLLRLCGAEEKQPRLLEGYAPGLYEPQHTPLKL